MYFLFIFRVLAVEHEQVSSLKSQTRKWEGLVDLHIDEVDEIIVLLRDMGRVSFLQRQCAICKGLFYLSFDTE